MQTDCRAGQLEDDPLLAMASGKRTSLERSGCAGETEAMRWLARAG